MSRFSVYGKQSNGANGRGAIFILSQTGRLALFFFLSLAAAHAAEPPTPVGSAELTTAGRPAPDLDSILKAVLANNGQIQEATQEIEIAKAQVAQARAAALPHGGGLFIAAPIFQETGDALHSESNWGKWGPYLQGGLQVIQPIYSFGQLSSYQHAADSQVNAKTELAEVKRWEVLTTTKDFYYSYLMANDLYKLVDDLTGFLDEAIKTAEKQAGSKHKSSIKPHDIYHLKTANYDLAQKKLQAIAGKRTAERAVLWISGGSYGSVPTRTLQPEPFQQKTLEEYLKMARTNRPEYRALAAGEDAYHALAEAKRAQSYPILFVGGFISGAWSPVREPNNSVYMNNPYNNFQGGAGLGLKLDIEWWRHAAEAAEQRANEMKLKATESYAVPGIELQVKKAYWEVEQAVEGLKIATERRDTGRKWFVSNGMGWSVGITPAKDLMESLQGSGEARQNYIQTVYQYNMALAHLSQAVGKEITELHYRD